MDEILFDSLRKIEAMMSENVYHDLIQAQNERMSALSLNAARMSIPEHFRRVITEQWYDTDSYLKCLQKLGSGLRKGKVFIISHGPTGTGKTSAVCQLAVKMAVSSQIRTNNLFFLDTMEAEIASFAPTGWPTVFRQATSSGILILDDIGTERWPNRIQAIIAKRYNQNGWLLCTTNHSPRQLESIYGIRTMRRLRELGTFVECDKNVEKKI